MYLSQVLKVNIISDKSLITYTLDMMCGKQYFTSVIDPFLSAPHRKRKRVFAFCSVILVDSQRLYPYLPLCSITARECPLHYCRARRAFQKLLHQNMSSLEASASTYRTSTCQHPLHRQQPPFPPAVDPGNPPSPFPTEWSVLTPFLLQRHPFSNLRV